MTTRWDQLITSNGRETSLLKKLDGMMIHCSTDTTKGERILSKSCRWGCILWSCPVPQSWWKWRFHVWWRKGYMGWQYECDVKFQFWVMSESKLSPKTFKGQLRANYLEQFSLATVHIVSCIYSGTKRPSLSENDLILRKLYLQQKKNSSDTVCRQSMG